jgi:hypothetical protein
MHLSRLEIKRGRGAPAAPAVEGELQLLETLRRAADALTPVVIDPGPERPRIGTFVDAVEEAGPGGPGALILRPVPAGAIPQMLAASVAIRSCDPDDAWMVTAGAISAVDGDAARVELRGAVLEPLASRKLARTATRGREPLVLALPSGTEDLDGCVFPVMGLAASHCIVEAAAPLSPGQRFEPVELIGDRRILRRAAATVLETIPWVEHDGSRRFRCRLLLERSDGPPDDGEGEGYDLLSNPGRIRRLLELACMLSTSGFQRAPGWQRGAMQFEALEADRLRVRLGEALPDSIPLPVHVNLGCELFAVSYEMQVRPIRRRGAVLEVTLPLVMRRRRRRREQRARVPDGRQIWVTFRSPATGLEHRRAVRDLSFGGLCFEADPADDVIWPGLVLEEVRIALPDRTIAGGEIEVRGVETGADGMLICHAANRHPDRVGDWDLVSLLGSLKHPSVEIHDGSDFRGALRLYRKAGLLAEFIERNLEPVLPRAAVSWRRLHDAHAQIGCTFLYRAEGAGAGEGPVAAFSGVRAWERTWLAQHFASSATASGQVTGALHRAYLDFVLPRSEAHYSAFFARSENHGMNAFYDRFSSLTASPGTMERVGVDFWVRRAGATPVPVLASPYRRRELCPADERAVAHAAERSLGRLAAQALSFQPGEISLRETDERFKLAGLRRHREGHVVTTRDGRVVTAVLGEHTSPGVNLTWMLNAWWVLPVHPRLDDGRATALALETVLRAPAPTPAGDRFAITVPGVPEEPLAAAGFERLATVYLYVFSRSGLHRYYQYVADRYGEVDAAVARRQVARLARRSA